MPAVDPLTFGSQLKVWLNADTLTTYADGDLVSLWPYANDGLQSAVSVSGAANRMRRGVGYYGVTLESSRFSWNLATPLTIDGGFTIIAEISTPNPLGTFATTLMTLAGTDDVNSGNFTIDGNPLTVFYATDITGGIGSQYFHGLQPPAEAFEYGTANKYLAGWSYTDTAFDGQLDGGASASETWAKPIFGVMGQVLRHFASTLVPLTRNFLVFQPALTPTELNNVLLYFGYAPVISFGLTPNAISGASTVNGDLTKLVNSPTNMSFESPGPTAGSALGWSTSITAAYEQIATFSDLPWEGFESAWSNDSATFSFAGVTLGIPQLTTLQSTSKEKENFEELWNSSHLSQFSLGATVPPDLSPPWELGGGYGDNPFVETFQPNWANGTIIDDPDGYFYTVMGATVHGVLEYFDVGWGAYIVAFSPVHLELAPLSSGELLETFEFVFPRVQMTVNAATDVIHAPGSIPQDDAVVVFYVTGVALPGGISAGETYHVVNCDEFAETFQISATMGGAPIDILDAGNGVFSVGGFPQNYWDTRCLSLPLVRGAQNVGTFASQGYCASIWTGRITTTVSGTFGAAGVSNFNPDGEIVLNTREFTASSISAFTATLGVSVSDFQAPGVSAFIGSAGRTFVATSAAAATFIPALPFSSFALSGVASTSFGPASQVTMASASTTLISPVAQATLPGTASATFTAVQPMHAAITGAATASFAIFDPIETAPYIWFEPRLGYSGPGGGLVSSLPDLSGGGRHAVQADGFYQPTVASDGGVDALRILGDKYLDAGDISAFPTTGGESFMVFRSGTDNTDNFIHYIGGYDGSFHPAADEFIYSCALTAGLRGPIIPASSVLSRHAFYVKGDASTWVARQNNIEVENAVGNTVEWSVFPTVIGGLSDGYIFLIIFMPTMTAAHRSSMLNYINNNYGLSLTVNAFSPADAGLDMWIRADLGRADAGGGLVSALADQSGFSGAPNFVQATGSKQPLLVSSAINNKPALSFDGVNDVLESDVAFDITLGDYLVIAKTAGATGGVLCGSQVGANDYQAGGLIVWGEGVETISCYWQDHIQSGPPLFQYGTNHPLASNTWYALEYRITATSWNLYANGVLIESIDPLDATKSTITSVIWRLGARSLSGGASNSANCHVAEIMHKPGGFGAYLPSITEYVRNRYGLEMAP